MIGGFYNSIGGYYQQHDNDVVSAMNFYHKALAASISAKNVGQQSEILYSMAWIKWRLGDYLGGQMDAYESRRLAKVSANLYIETRAMRMEAMCWDILGNYQRSVSLYTRARALLTLCGMSGGPLDCAVINCLTNVHKLKSEYAEAHSVCHETLEKISAEKNPYTHAVALISIAEVDLKIGTPKDDVQNKIDTAKSIFTTMGELRLITVCDTVLADLYLREGEKSSARVLFKKCLGVSWGKNTDVVTCCLERLANLHHWDALYRTSAWTIVFFVYALKSKQKLEVHKSLQFLGDMFLAENEPDTALTLFTVALEGFTQMDVHCSRAECMLRLGDIISQKGDLLKAVDLWKTARPLFDRSSQVNQTAEIYRRLSAANLDEEGQN